MDVAVVAAGQDESVRELVSRWHHTRGHDVARVAAQRLGRGEADSVPAEAAEKRTFRRARSRNC